MAIHGVPVRLVDGAGLGAPRDPVDAEGMRRVRQVLADSDLVLVVLDVSRPVSTADREVLTVTATRERLVIANKCDLQSSWQGSPLAECACSALTGEGMTSVARWLESWAERRTAFDGDEGGFVASLRVLERLGAVESALRRAVGTLDRVPVEAALVDLQQARLEMDRILGNDADDAVLDRIFARFCVGK